MSLGNAERTKAEKEQLPAPALPTTHPQTPWLTLACTDETTVLGHHTVWMCLNVLCSRARGIRLYRLSIVWTQQFPRLGS